MVKHDPKTILTKYNLTQLRPKNYHVASFELFDGQEDKFCKQYNAKIDDVILCAKSINLETKIWHIPLKKSNKNYEIDTEQINPVDVVEQIDPDENNYKSFRGNAVFTKRQYN